MGSKNRHYSIESQDKGFDDIGFAQTAGEGALQGH